MAQLYCLRINLFRLLIICSTLQFFSFKTTYAQVPAVTFTTVVGGFSQPLDVVNAGDASNRLFIVQKGGLIRIYNGTSVLATPFLDLSSVITAANSEQGLLSLAFHPQYATNRYFFVYYTRTGDGAVTIARYRTSTTDPNVADPASGVVLLTVPKPNGQTNHNGGKLNFGVDGNLYFGLGDGGGAGDANNLAQNGNALQGKILRLNVNNFDNSPFYTIPSDNPYVNDASVRDEVWAIGLRNPWRWSFDRVSHDMWIGDVGQNLFEEVDFAPAPNTGGLNFGWRCYEGLNAFNTSVGCPLSLDTTLPILVYPHNNTTGGFAITGGYVYHGPDFPSLTGYYVTIDYLSGNMWKIIRNGLGVWDISTQKGPTGIVGFGEAENGALFAVNLDAGLLLRVEASAAAPVPVRLINFSGESENGGVLLNWQTGYELNFKQFDVQYSKDGVSFETAGSVAAGNNPNGGQYSFRHIVVNTGRLYYKLKLVDINGSYEYSKTIAVTINGAAANYINPTIITTHMVSLYLTDQFNTVEIVGMDGRIIKKEMIGGRTGRIDITVPNTAFGTFLVRVRGEQNSIVQKVLIQ